MKFHCKAIKIDLVFLIDLELRLIPWYNARVLILSSNARVLEHVINGETLLMKNSSLIGIWVWRRCFE